MIVVDGICRDGGCSYDGGGGGGGSVGGGSYDGGVGGVTDVMGPWGSTRDHFENKNVNK